MYGTFAYIYDKKKQMRVNMPYMPYMDLMAHGTFFPALCRWSIYEFFWFQHVLIIFGIPSRELGHIPYPTKGEKENHTSWVGICDRSHEGI